MKQTKKILALLLALALSLSLAACGGKDDTHEENKDQQIEEQTEGVTTPDETEEDETPASAHEGEWSYVDGLGREAHFNGPLTRVAPSGKLAQQCIYALAPETIIGLTTEMRGGEASFFPAEFTELPVFGTFYGKKADFNLESVLAADPQIIIDVGEIKGDAADMAAELDTLQEQLGGIPVVFLSAKTLADTSSAITELGVLFEKPDEAKVLADYCDATIAEAMAAVDTIPEADRKTVYYALYESGLTTCAEGSFHTQVIDLVGAQNVVPADMGKKFIDIDMEQLLDWNPQVILFAPGSNYAAVGEDATWQQLDAISSGSYYEIPGLPYSWVDAPPAANRIIGVKWLGNLLYPEAFQYDMVQETITFYDLFYHVDITEDQARDLMANSTFKAN